ncbi:endoribonuclease Dicer homolog 3a isoform X2 [Selaginella moellendorffii]|uniref:endoribonuclease Dicer homolog 3a isoform X2 n=1 Tax=Selaginella moellendorffii TaxID=88036 RepID=UPI000D1CAA96|nr:endoribonuclease Dicer homolog 3a isoform X2 [Selaginella moellendorffii]|eukprot:XP_024521053.1 endoribonuclease Dicer homolog 3a isoform X2 [Selaginella moellendorffii]
MDCAKRAKTMIPRGYQKDVFQRALKENIIVNLGTGTGKTMIAIMLIQSFEERLSMPQEKRIAVFLAPTVNLVIQQARAIESFTVLKVGDYYGDKGVDSWSVNQWQAEVDSHQVLVMTPQVFLNALGTSALKLEFVEVLVMDECHHAHKNHPYALIMKTHYHVSCLKSKPKIFGMTASPVIQKGVSSSYDCNRKLTVLESILDAKVYTVEDKSEVEEYYPNPTQYKEYYDRPKQRFSSIQTELEILKDRLNSEAACNCSDYELQNKIKKSIDRLHLSINHCLVDLGLLPALLAVEILQNRNKSTFHSKWKPDVSLEEEEVKTSLKERFLQNVSSIPRFSQVSSRSYPTLEEMTSGTLSPKVLVLLDVLERLRGITNMRCIVFVERVIVAMALAKLISRLSFLSHLRCDYMTGVRDTDARNPTQQQEVLDAFAGGKLNLLIATSVAEEGLDVQACCAVIRFDVCQTLRSHVQSRGRARNRLSSTYVWLLETGNVEQLNLFNQLCTSERVVEDQVIFRNYMDITREAPPEGDLEFFRVESGACKSSQDSVSFIHEYCARLGDRYYNAKPKFSFKDSFVCTVEFPPNAPLRSVEGPLRRTEQLAKKAACLQACRKLYDMGEVRPDTLCPDVDDFDEEDQSMRKNESGKRKEIFSTAKPLIFEGSWVFNESGVQLQFYKICFVIEPPESRTYSNFGFLVNCVIDAEVTDSEVTLFSRNRVVNARVHRVGPIQLDANQVKAAKAYQELLLNGAFNRLARCSGSPQEILWNKSQAFLLLPVHDDNDSIDWTSVHATAGVYRTLCSNFSPSSPMDGDGVGEKTHADVLCTANGYVHSSALQDMVVATVHNGRLFCVTGVLENFTAASLLPKRGFTYIDYYKDKYQRTLRLPEQPLLKAKPTHAFHNLPIRPKEQEGDHGSRQEESFVELPPELCLCLEIKSGLIRSLYFVPSFLHRFTSTVCAIQLRSPLWPWIPAAKILEAITSKKCHEEFSYESLELLGDSFLKYVVTQKLFLVYDKKHEGQLSARRSRATCNAALHQLAKSSGIAEYIRDEEFNPSNWTGPGMLTSDSSKCRHQQGSYENEENYFSSCANGHRGIRRKALADVVEALIGAYLATSGPPSAMELMKQLGIDIEFDIGLLASARQASLPAESFQHLQASLESLEHKLQYKFQNRSLLVEAITHASQPNCLLCYQRLEFLGDGVLDFLVSRHLFETHPGLPPGTLTDLRSAAVNNKWFARLVLRHGLHQHLQHGSVELDCEIRKFVQNVKEKPDASCFEDLSAPKVLGDLLESITGAIFVDTNFDLEKLWRVVLPLLSPLVTPATLRFHPVRILMELCARKGMKVSFFRTEATTTEVRVTFGEESLVETSQEKPRKSAKIDAALKMLASLQVSSGNI